MGAKKPPPPPPPLLLRRRLLLAAVLLSVEGNVQGVPASLGGEYGVKLCGREFIRAVIFICGGSRWKRFSLRQGMEQPPPPPPPVPSSARAEFAQMNSDKELENTKLQSVLEPELEQLRSVSQPTGQLTMNDLFNNVYVYNEYIPASDNFSEYIHQLEEVARKNRDEPGVKFKSNSMDSNNFPWIRHHRRKRDFSMGVAGMCCKWGCTKTEISVLC